MDNMETEAQGEFKSAFDQFFSNPSENTKSEEQDADAFDEEDGYEDEEQESSIAADDFDDFDEDDEMEDSENSEDTSKLDKRLKDKDKFISQIQSERDQLKNEVKQIQQQLNYLISNQNQNQQADDFEDLIDDDPEEYGTREEFQKLESKKKKLEELKADAKQGKQILSEYQALQQKKINFTQSQSDYKDILTYAKKVSESSDPTVQRMLSEVAGDEATTYMFLKYLRAQDQIKSIKNKIKGRKKSLPPTDFKSNSGPKSKKGGSFSDILMGNAARNMERMESFDLKK